jgi:hypothetical protein
MPKAELTLENIRIVIRGIAPVVESIRQLRAMLEEDAHEPAAPAVS